jgi:hypothetical protein
MPLVILSIPPLLCILFGWRAWKSALSDEEPRTWRFWISLAALISASLSFIFQFIFLIHGYYGPASFTGPPVGVWLLVGRTNGAFWLFAVIAAIVSKGRERVPVLSWAATSFACNYIFMNLRMD